MPIKRRDRENSSDNGSKPTFVISTDHELFLQAFEKPTQIYRYLRTRNRLSPIFLHRNLAYMKDRMSRNHKKRENFRVDSLLATITRKHAIEEENSGAPNNFMTLMFLGFYNKLMVDEQFVEVEIVLSKISQMKRKDSFKSKQDRLGSAIVKINPVDMIGKIPAVSVSTELFKPAGTGLLNSSCILQLNITVLPNFTPDQEPHIKTQEMVMRSFETDLVIFDKHNRCTLSDGEYELSLQECSTSPRLYSPKKHPTWEIIPDHCIDEFNKGDDFAKSPSLKFRLSWTKDKYAEVVDRPLPITIRKGDFLTNTTTSTKENRNSLNRTTFAAASAADKLVNSQTSDSTASNAIGYVPTTSSNFAATDSNWTKTKSTVASVSVPNAGNTSMVVKLHDIASRIIYHFIYNNNSSQQTETFDNFNCPWCCLHCLNLYSLLKHLKLSHARFNFTYVPTPNGVRVDVSINEQFDGSYIGSPHDLVGPAGSAFARAGPVRRTIVTRILVCRSKYKSAKPKYSLNEFLEIDENELNSQRPYVTGHNRLYHHTMTCLPVHPKGLDIDSEGECDPDWLQQKTMQMIDEFTDVNEGEKELMKMWNLHIMRNGYVGDIQIPLACEMFLDVHGKELLRKNLYKNFMLHLCNFFDYGLLSPETLQKIIQKLQGILSDFADGREAMQQGNDGQLSYWRTVGCHKSRTIPVQSTPKTAIVTRSTIAGTKADRTRVNDLVVKDEPTPNTKNTTDKPSKSNDKTDTAKSRTTKLSHSDLNDKGADAKTTAKDSKSGRNSAASATKRKSTGSKNGNSTESPPRRRSASAALQMTGNSSMCGKRRNSTAIGSSAASAMKKGKRLSLTMPKTKADK